MGRSARTAVAAVGALLTVIAPAQGQAPDRTFFGMGDWGVMSPAELGTLERAEVGTIRVSFDHASPAGRGNWAAYDLIVADAARAGQEVLALLTNKPFIRNKLRARPPRAPRRRRAWSAWVEELATRYGEDGLFWALRPDLPYVPIRAYQVWNEPNLKAHWYGARPSPRGYRRLLGLTRTALLRAQPEALVVLAGIPDTRRGTRLRPYLGGLYRLRGFRRLFDVGAMHPYGRNAAAVEEHIEAYRRVMRRAGDRRKQVWITEIGWATDGAPHPLRTSRRGQAERVEEVFGLFLEERTRWRLGRVYWFALQDRPLDPREQDWWGPKTGFFSRTGFAKPAWEAFVRHTGGDADERLGHPPPPSYFSFGATLLKVR